MTTYYVDPSSGSDGNAGTSFGAAWATTQKALDTAVAGDEVRLCQTATETTSAQIDADTNAGNHTSGYIEFVSYNSAGTTQEDGYEIQASASITNLINYTSAAEGLRWTGVDFNGNSNVTAQLLDHAASGAGNYTQYNRCTIRGAGTHGAEMRATQVSFAGCDIHSNGADGLRAQSASNSRWGTGAIIGCRIHDNSSDGIGGVGWQGLTVANNEIYDNGAAGIETVAGAGQPSVMAIVNNTVYGNGTHGIELENIIGDTGDVPTHVTIFGNSSSQNLGYQYYFGTATPAVLPLMDYNHSYDSGAGSGDTDASAGLPGSNNASGDPLFTSVTDGSEDFTPTTGSPLIGANLNGGNIGAVAHADGGGGSGVLRRIPKVIGA